MNVWVDIQKVILMIVSYKDLQNIVFSKRPYINWYESLSIQETLVNLYVKRL